MSDIHIVDVIDHRNKYAVQVEIVLNRYPATLFERRGNWLLGNDGCVFQFYACEWVTGPANWKAFGGRKFDIPMADGSFEHATGQWWDKTPSDYAELTYGYGINTIEGLNECYLFYCGHRIDRLVVDEWRKNHEPSNNYHKYDARHPDFGKHRIVSEWEPTSDGKQP